eukprot:5221915-Alexandrium_andersonii.AAC.1
MAATLPQNRPHPPVRRICWASPGPPWTSAATTMAKASHPCATPLQLPRCRVQIQRSSDRQTTHRW